MTALMRLVQEILPEGGFWAAPDGKWYRKMNGELVEVGAV